MNGMGGAAIGEVLIPYQQGGLFRPNAYLVEQYKFKS